MRFNILAVVVAFASCKAATTAQNNSATVKHTIVYKAKADYGKLVPVLLSADKSKIISYPDPADLKDGSGNFTYPEQLSGGYLLDKRGIGKNTAFLSLTYEQYAARPVMPLTEMEKLIIDKSPFTELYDCGTLSSNNSETDILNGMIKDGTLKKNCKSIK